MIFHLLPYFLPVIYGYIGWRLITPSDFSSALNILLWAILILFLLALPINFYLRKFYKQGLVRKLFLTIGYTGLGFFLLVFIFLLLRDLLVVFLNGTEWFWSFVDRDISYKIISYESIHMYRDILLSKPMNVGIIITSVILTSYGFNKARRPPRIFTVQIPILNLTSDLQNFRIVQITDLHVNALTNIKLIKTIIKQVNSLNPDIVVFTGDIADDPPAGLREKIYPPREISAHIDSFFVTGNHEYGRGREAWIDEIKRLGFKVLLNERRIIQKGTARILIAGVTDFEAYKFNPNHLTNPEITLKNAPISHIKILLAHQPKSILEGSRFDFDIQISGHTHGGQFIPWNFLVGLQQPVVNGLHKYKNTWIYVSRGTGYWGPPLRLGIPSEITEIILVQKDAT